MEKLSLKKFEKFEIKNNSSIIGGTGGPYKPPPPSLITSKSGLVKNNKGKTLLRVCTDGIYGCP
jgi:hypothetical protein